MGPKPCTNYFLKGWQPRDKNLVMCRVNWYKNLAMCCVGLFDLPIEVKCFGVQEEFQLCATTGKHYNKTECLVTVA